WLKAYTNIGYEQFKAAIDEAHKQGIKVTGHICSISFTEAVGLGIDNIEHGLFTNSDYDPSKEQSECPMTFMQHAVNVDIEGPEVANTFRLMIDNDVPMTSTLAVYELFVPNRPTKDPRALEAMAPEVRADYLKAREQIDSSPDAAFSPEAFQKAMAYERRFVEMGGLLAAGVDPTGNGGALPGYGDQRNFELLREAGFTPEETVRIMSLNGATVLGVDGELGSVEVGKTADLVLIRGDLTGDPATINQVVTVFKDGIGYDSKALLDAVKGRVGIS
ncbi:MAG: amidohydrolase family protein, partial [Gemmatimonadetes bacterium]|nr:amidohydrolase family protein [Gemmatimonadota bacterium]